MTAGLDKARKTSGSRQKLGGCAKAHPPKEKLQSLEDDLHCELHVELLARAKAGSTVEVADGVTHETESGARVAGGARRCCPAATAHRPRSRSKIDPIEKVKHIGLQPDPDPLGNRQGLEDGQVHVSKVRGVEPVASEVANAGRRQRKCSRVPPLRPSVRR